MRRRGSILALGVLLLALAPASAQAAQSKCQKLDGHDLAPAGKVKLVERKNEYHGTDLVGCVLPAGKLVLAAQSGDAGSGGDSYDLRQVAGHHVLLRETGSSPSASNEQTEVVDLRSGRRYKVAWMCTTPSTCGDDGESARRALINSSGQAAAIVHAQGSDLVSVEGFSSRGTREVLDTGTLSEIPASSLKLDGHVASWRNDGARMSARLPSVTDCQRLKAKGEDLAGAKKVKLVERKNSDGGTDLVGCVLPAGKVSVVASRSKISGQTRSYELLQVAGHEVLVRGKLINPYGAGVSTYVFDLKRGSSYTAAESCFDEHGAACAQTYARRAFVNAQGQAAVLLRTDGESALQVLGFASTGESRVLDTGGPSQIPKSSLSLDGHVVRWMHSGVHRHATLSG
ncbi:MAG: hypothetical protein ACJ760_08170 [Thermoleophilaceae bacterium]